MATMFKLNAINYKQIIEYLKTYQLFILVMLYIVFNIMSNNLQANFTSIAVIGGKIPSQLIIMVTVYLIINSIARLTHAKLAWFVIMLGIFCNSCFLLIISAITRLPVPQHSEAIQIINTQLVNNLGTRITGIFYSAILINLIFIPVELAIFCYLHKKFKLWGVADLTSILILLLIQYFSFSWQ
jgi:hypothetical protein